MNAVSLPAALLELESATDRLGAGVLAFDGDGTLWTGDVADDVVDALLHDRALREPAAELLRAASEAHFGIPVTTRDPHVLFAQLLAEDRAGRLPHRRTCELIGEMLAGWGEAELHAYCIEVFARRGLRDRLIAEAWAMREHGRALGHRVVVVSASPAPIVRAACEVAGMPDAYAGVAVSSADGVYIAHVVRPIPYAEGKVVALTPLAAGRPIIAAFGDNRFDLAMLQAAQLAYAVRPKPALLELAASFPALRTLQNC